MKILVADDHRLIREGVKPLLRQIDATAEVLEAWDAATLWDAVRRHPVLDLALVDLDMPGMQGVSGLGELRDAFPSLPIVVVTGSEDPATARELLRIGVLGYIPKSSSSSVMTHAIQLVLAGGQYLPSLILAGTAEVEHPVTRPAGAAAESGGAPEGRRLSPRQLDVLRLLAEGQSNKMIARALGVSLGTVKTHLVQIFQILGVRNRTAAVLAARDYPAGTDAGGAHARSTSWPQA